MIFSSDATTASSLRMRANSIARVSNLKQIQLAVNGYADDHKEVFPDIEGPTTTTNNSQTFNWIHTLYKEKYLTGEAVFICRSQHREIDLKQFYQVYSESNRRAAWNLLQSIQNGDKLL